MNQTEIYVVRDSTIQAKRIEIIDRQGQQVFARGLETSDEIISGSTNGLFIGQKVIVNKAKS